MKRRTLPIVLISLLLGLTFDWFFNGKLPGISVFIYASLILGFTFYLARQFSQSLNKSIYWLSPVILFFSSMVFVRASPFLMVMNIFITIYLLTVVARLVHQPTAKLGQYGIMQYFTVMGSAPIGIARDFFAVLRKALNNRNASEPKSSFAPILRGLLLSLPILFVFGLLLSSADLVFKGFINSIFAFNVSSETVFRGVLIGLVTSMFIGAYAFIFMPSVALETNSAPGKQKFNVGATESSIILGSVSLLFFVFVTIQLAYLFGGSGQIASTGYTYAEYARKGFFELIMVAAISLLLITTIKKCTKLGSARETRIFKWLAGILIAEVMVIMLSAHMRLSLYEEAYGFTTLRLLSHIFTLWLAFAFALLLFHIVRGLSEQKFTFQLFLSALCFFALINVINPDNFIARQNIARFNEVGKIDVHYLGALSEDAVPTIAKLLDQPNKDLQKSAANILYSQKRPTMNASSDWQSLNLARQHSDQVFRDKADQIEAGKQ